MSFTSVFKSRILAAVLLLAAVFWLLPGTEAHAASVAIEFSAPSFIVEGEEFALEINLTAGTVIGEVKADFSFDPGFLSFVSGPGVVSCNDGVISINDTGKGSSNGQKTYVIKFTALKAGSCEIVPSGKPLVYSFEDNTEMMAQVLGCTVTIRSTATLSSDNTLADLKLFDKDGNKIGISPAFSKDTEDYGAKVPFSMTKVVVVADASEKNAVIDISGEKDLRVGTNSVKVFVYAENGDKRIYTVLVIREGLENEKTDDNGNPIGQTDPDPTGAPTATPTAGAPVVIPPEELTTGVFAEPLTHGIKVSEYHTYTSLGAGGLTVPKGFSETRLLIGEEAIIAYESLEFPAGILLVPLANEQNEIRWYTYDRVEKTFQRLNEAEVKYVTTEAVYDEQLLGVLEKYEKTQATLLVITGVCIAVSVALLIALLGKNLKK